MLDYQDQAKEFFNQFQGDFQMRNREELIILKNFVREDPYEQGLFQKYMENKFTIQITQYGYKLLLHFSQLRMLVILLHIFNLHIDFKFISDKWTNDQHSSSSILLSFTPEQLEKINKKEILWGRLPITPEAAVIF